MKKRFLSILLIFLLFLMYSDSSLMMYSGVRRYLMKPSEVDAENRRTDDDVIEVKDERPGRNSNPCRSLDRAS